MADTIIEIKTETDISQPPQHCLFEKLPKIKSKENGNFNWFFGFILTFVYDIGMLYPNNNKKTMQIHN